MQQTVFILVIFLFFYFGSCGRLSWMWYFGDQNILWDFLFLPENALRHSHSAHLNS